jgi:hyperosmotically inducible protein
MKNRRCWLISSAVFAGALSVLAAGCSKPQEASVTPPPTTTVGTEIDDSVVTARVKSALLADPDVKSFDFKVETRKGEVQLSGFVGNQIQIDHATAVARAVAGVKTIDNKMTLQGAATTVGNKVDDSIVTTRVKSALLADANIKSFDIAVVTRKGEVQLSGFVDNRGQIDRAVEVASGVEGVRKVGNEMSVKN